MLGPGSGRLFGCALPMMQACRQTQTMPVPRCTNKISPSLRAKEEKEKNSA